MASHKCLQNIYSKATSVNVDEQCSAILYIRVLLSSEPVQQNNFTIINAVISNELVPVIVKCLENNSQPTLQFEAAWALTNIASGTTAHVQNIVDAEGVPALVRLLGSRTSDVCEQGLWALGNIICNNLVFRDYILDCGIVPPLSTLLQSNPPLSVQRKGAWVLRNLCHVKPLPGDLLLSQIVSALRGLLHLGDFETIIDIVWAVANIVGAGGKQVHLVYKSGIIQHLVPFLSSNEIQIQFAVLVILSTVVSGTEEQTQLVIDCGALPYLQNLLTFPQEKICRLSLFFLSNITAGTASQIQSLISANLLPLIIQNLNEGNMETRKEAAWVLVNFTEKGDTQQILTLGCQDIALSLMGLLDCNDSQLVEKVLVGINNVFKAVEPGKKALADMIQHQGGLAKLQSLLGHGNNDRVIKLAQDIIKQHFYTSS